LGSRITIIRIAFLEMAGSRAGRAAAVVVPTLFCLVSTLVIRAEPTGADCSPDDAAVCEIIHRYFAAWARKDLDAMTEMWVAGSPGLGPRRDALQRFFATEQPLPWTRARIRELTREGDRASARVSLEAEPGSSAGPPRTHDLRLSQDASGWRIVHDASPEEDLAAKLASAESDARRAELLATAQQAIPGELASALISQGHQMRSQGKYPEALAVYGLAERLADETGEAAILARALASIGLVHLRQGRYDQALEHFERSLTLSESVGDEPEIAAKLTMLGMVHYQRSDYALALERYEQSLAAYRRLGNAIGIAATLGNIGLIHLNLGQTEEALGSSLEALARLEAVGDKWRISAVLNNLGELYEALGDYRKALSHYERSLALKESLGVREDLVPPVRNIGRIHALQGHYALAAEYYRRVLDLTESLEAQGDVAHILIDMGDIHLAQGERAKALECFQRSRAGAEALGKKRTVASALRGLGNVHEAEGDNARALDSYRESFELGRALESKPAMALALVHMAGAYSTRGAHVLALETAESAAALAREMGDPAMLWEALTAAGRAHAALDQPARARQAFEDAIDIVEGLRGHVTGPEPDQQRFFEGRVAPYYELIELHVAQGAWGEALAFSERVKARVLLDVLHGGRGAITKSLTTGERVEEAKLKARISSLNLDLRRAFQADSTRERVEDLRSRLEKARLSFEAFESQLYAVHPELRNRRGEAPIFRLAEAGTWLQDGGTAFLEYAVAERQTHLFVLSGDAGAEPDLRVYAIPVGRTELSRLAEEFRQSLASRDLTFRTPARRLYDLLLKPAQSQLAGRAHLAIVPDGALWQLPFHALVTGAGRYLVEQTEVSYAPSLTVLREMRRVRAARHESPPHRSLMAVGNPSLGRSTAPRATEARRGGRLEPLPETEREVQTLARLYGAGRSRVFTRVEAREDLAKKEAPAFDVLHFATHGVLDEGSPMYSHIVLSEGGGSDDGLLEAWEIMNLDLNADLAVLSACETGRGRVGAGEGMIGLSWAFFVAGCPTTVVSQWKVESASTTELMLAFHRNLKKGQSKATALRSAALKLLWF
jgi:CHAT domain-containing protein/Tfp pilus assembly protein PilF